MGCIRTLFSSLLLFIIVLEAFSLKNSGKVIYRNLPYKSHDLVLVVETKEILVEKL